MDQKLRDVGLNVATLMEDSSSFKIGIPDCRKMNWSKIHALCTTYMAFAGLDAPPKYIYELMLVNSRSNNSEMKKGRAIDLKQNRSFMPVVNLVYLYTPQEQYDTVSSLKMYIESSKVPFSPKYVRGYELISHSVISSTISGAVTSTVSGTKAFASIVSNGVKSIATPPTRTDRIEKLDKGEQSDSRLQKVNISDTAKGLSFIDRNIGNVMLSHLQPSV
jgi:hypothetical protein